MIASIIKIGNSKGLRLSKTILERYKIRDSVELVLEEEHIILRPLDSPRQGWAESFKQMNAENDDTLLINDVFEDEDIDE